QPVAGLAGQGRGRDHDGEGEETGKLQHGPDIGRSGRGMQASLRRGPSYSCEPQLKRRKPAGERQGFIADAKRDSLAGMCATKTPTGMSSPFLDGHFLLAMPGMADDRFARSVIYVCAHSEEGAMG